MFPFANPRSRRAGSAAVLRPQDVFATSLYTGNGDTQTIMNGLDLAGKGGLVWFKDRSSTYSHGLFDSFRGVSKGLDTSGSGAEFDYPGGLTALNSTGFTLGSGAFLNGSGLSKASWSFCRAAKFFDTNIFTHLSGMADTIDLSALGTVGFAVIKRRDAAGAWYAWHISLTAGNNLSLNTTASQSTTNAYISVSGTTLTFAAGAPAGNYVYEAWAHNPDTTNGIIQCGSYTTDSNAIGNNGNTIPLGWRPQFLITKPTITAGKNWWMQDAARGANALAPNSSVADSPQYALGVITHPCDGVIQALTVLRIVPKGLAPVRRAVSTTVRMAASPSAAHIAR